MNNVTVGYYPNLATIWKISKISKASRFILVNIRTCVLYIFENLVCFALNILIFLLFVFCDFFGFSRHLCCWKVAKSNVFRGTLIQCFTRYFLCSLGTPFFFNNLTDFKLSNFMYNVQGDPYKKKFSLATFMVLFGIIAKCLRVRRTRSACINSTSFVIYMIIILIRMSTWLIIGNQKLFEVLIFTR